MRRDEIFYAPCIRANSEFLEAPSRKTAKMKITTIGIDLAKEVFQTYVVDGRGKAARRKHLKRKDMAKYFANFEPCLIVLEAEPIGSTVG
jgi:hypothetical protein